MCFGQGLIVFNKKFNTSNLFKQAKNKVKRVKTIYDCQADNDDELTFVEGEVIIVTGEEDQEWWVSKSAMQFANCIKFWN